MISSSSILSISFKSFCVGILLKQTIGISDITGIENVDIIKSEPVSAIFSVVNSFSSKTSMKILLLKEYSI